MLIIAGGVLVCLALLWWLSGWSFGGSAVIATGELDEHSTIKRLIAQTKNEKAKSLLREVGKRSTMNNRNRLVPALLALVGVGLIAFGSIGTALPRLPVDLLKWLPSIQVTKYPDAAVIFLEEASERDMDFALVLANKAFTDSLDESIN
jgi:hypothetical protein